MMTQNLLQEDSVIRCDYLWLYYNIIIFEREKNRIKIYILLKPLELLINALSNNPLNGYYFHWRKLTCPSALDI